MKKFKILLPFLMLTTMTLSISAKVLIISDIDDTLKVSSARNTVDMISTYKTTSAFMGMSFLLNTLKAQYQNELDIQYVTAAVDSIVGSDTVKKSHLNFLAINKFPKGSTYFRSSFFEKDYKLTTIRNIVKKANPDQIILIGDNADKDEPIYFKLKNEFDKKGIKTLAFIHRIHKNEKENYQPVFNSSIISYVTSAEIAADLLNLSLMNSFSYNQFLSNQLPKIIANDSNTTIGDQEIAFPKYLNCKEYNWSLSSNKELDTLKNILAKKCK